MGPAIVWASRVRTPGDSLQGGAYSVLSQLCSLTLEAWRYGQSSDDWFDRHTSQDLVYRVWVRIVTPGALEAAWARIVDEHGVDEEGVVPIGGVALIRVNDREAEEISGGEDALDSLE